VRKNPSLKLYMSEALEVGYENGLDLLDRETPVELEQVPQVCPFSLAEIFDKPIELKD
jgi:Domain of unknown function DUF29